MSIQHLMFGRLTVEAFKHEASQNFAVVMGTVLGIFLIGVLFYFKRWKWLWKEWLTSLDPKRIGVMYIVVVILIVFQRVCRCAHDAGPAGPLCRGLTWIYFCRSLSRGFFCPWDDHDLFCGHGGCFWADEFNYPLTNWGTRCGLSLFKLTRFLVICLRSDPDPSFHSEWGSFLQLAGWPIRRFRVSNIVQMRGSIIGYGWYKLRVWEVRFRELISW